MRTCVPQKKIADHGMLFSFLFVFILPLFVTFLSFLFFSFFVQVVYLTLLNMRVTFMRCVSSDILYIYRSISLIVKRALRTFALTVSAHPYCARKFTRHVMHESAR